MKINRIKPEFWTYRIIAWPRIDYTTIVFLFNTTMFLFYTPGDFPCFYPVLKTYTWRAKNISIGACMCIFFILAKLAFVISLVDHIIHFYTRIIITRLIFYKGTHSFGRFFPRAQKKFCCSYGSSRCSICGGTEYY